MYTNFIDFFLIEAVSTEQAAAYWTCPLWRTDRMSVIWPLARQRRTLQWRNTRNLGKAALLIAKAEAQRSAFCNEQGHFSTQAVINKGKLVSTEPERIFCHAEVPVRPRALAVVVAATPWKTEATEKNRTPASNLATDQR